MRGVKVLKKCKESWIEDDARGFTLVELMVVLFILTLTSIVMATGIPSAIEVYMRTIETSNADVALTTTISRLRDELSVADPATVTVGNGSNRVAEFTSLKTGNTILITNESDGITVTEVAKDPLGNVLHSEDNLLVPKKAGAGIRKTTFTIKFTTSTPLTFSPDKKYFTVGEIKVYNGTNVELTTLQANKVKVNLIASN